MDTKGYALNQDNQLMRCLAGSRLYGTYRPDSDWDWRGVVYTPTNVLLGLTKFEQYEQHGDQDITIWTLARFFELAQDNNPNILDILCAPPETWVYHKEAWIQVWRQRSIFLSENVRYRFSGYAVSQLKRLQGHHKWLIDPPSAAPVLEEYSGHIEKSEKGGQKLHFADESDKAAWERASGQWQQYQTWLRERNPARAELERKFGYDTKHGAHLVRLMLQAETLLMTGDYNPVLEGPTKSMVLGVLSGFWKYEELIEWAEKMDAYIKDLPTCLPKNPNRERIEEVLVFMQKSRIFLEGWGG
jgi:uncharacterized protein